MADGIDGSVAQFLLRHRESRAPGAGLLHHRFRRLAALYLVHHETVHAQTRVVPPGGCLPSRNDSAIRAPAFQRKIPGLRSLSVLRARGSSAGARIYRRGFQYAWRTVTSALALGSVGAAGCLDDLGAAGRRKARIAGDEFVLRHAFLRIERPRGFFGRNRAG